jgi:hypothetical protein
MPRPLAPTGPAATPSAGEQMQPPAPFPPPRPAAGPSPARTAAALAAQLSMHGLTGVYTASTLKFAVISVTAEITVWTDGRQLWCTQAGQRRTWPANGLAAAAAQIAALARPAAP